MENNTKAGSQVDSESSEKRSIDSGNLTENNYLFHSFDFTGGMKLLIPKTTKTTDAIMDGELKQIKVELKKFAEANSLVHIVKESISGEAGR